MLVARKVTGRSLPFIGRRMGDRDHTTVLYGWRAVRSLIDSGDTGIIAAVVRIIEQLTEYAH
jgi:chromosomal replication initiation ATPase DnaA